MAAYAIVNVQVNDPERYQEYSSQVLPTLEPFGGEFLVRGGRHEVLEGDWQPDRLVVVRFPDMEQARAWYFSPAYQRILPIRQQHSTGTFVLVEGV